MSILKELYIGNIGFDVRHYGKDSPFVNATKKKLDCLEKLEANLNDEEQKLLEQFFEADCDIEDIRHYDIFTSALKFGVLLMAEIFTGVQTNIDIHEHST